MRCRQGACLLLLTLAVILTACGEGKSDEEEIVEAIDYALVSTDPDACTEQMTQAFSEQTFRSEGPEAVESCEDNARGEESPNDPVKVTDVEVDGSTATAEVALTGGGIAGQTLAVALVEEDGDWKLDRIDGFAEFDRRKWVAEQRRGFESGHDVIEPRKVDCIIGAFREKSRPQLEEMMFGGSTQPEIEIYERCDYP